jgi:hypothetical protein
MFHFYSPFLKQIGQHEACIIHFLAFGFVHKIATFEKTAGFQVTRFLV